MPGPKDTVWPLEPHTGAKHAVLEKYLQAWLPIMTTYNGRVVFLDAFAGPGIYTGGERGSPIIAIDAVLNHSYGPVRTRAQIDFIFIEQDPERFASLQRQVATRPTLQNVTCDLRCGNFVSEVPDVLKRLHDGYGRPVPVFAFLDPFGYSDTPLDVVAQILRQDRCEILINFMHENINRFATSPDLKNQAHLDGLFGTPDWRSIVAQTLTPRERERRIHDLYQDQLRCVAGAVYVRSFRMRNINNATEYYLFFATKNLTGLDKMKQAMWSVDPSGAYDFTDFTDRDQLVLFQAKPDYALLRTLLSRRFTGQVVTVQTVQDYTISDTPFCSTHYKRDVLNPMELDGDIVVIRAPAKRRRGTFADMTSELRFS